MFKKALLAGACLSLIAGLALAAEPAASSAEAKKPEAGATAEPNKGVLFSPESVGSDGSVTIRGQKIDYHAIAGAIVVHPKGWDDAARRERSGADSKDLGDSSNVQAEASMFYTAYFKKGVPSADRPVTFVYNGGPGSSTMWLHMGAFRTAQGRDRRQRHPHPGRALFGGQQRELDPRRQRPGVHRRAGRGLLADRRQGQGKGLLGRRPGRLRLRAVHPGVPVAVRPLELAEVPVRRELRHAALGGANQQPDDRRQRRLQRRDAPLADPQLCAERRRHRVEPRQRYGLHHRRPDLCGDGLALQARPERAGRPDGLPEAGRALGDDRLRAGPDSGLRTRSGEEARNRRAIRRLHRPAGRLRAEGKSARHRRHVREDAPVVPRHDHRPYRYPLLRSGHGSRWPRTPTTIRKPRPCRRPM